MSNTTLDSAKVIATIDGLRARIADRFPDASLLRVCESLLGIARESQSTVRWILRPRLWVRILVLVFIVGVSALLVSTIAGMLPTVERLEARELIPLAEAALNEVVLIGAATLFLVSIENRLKRRRVIRSVNALRCVAHVIDMHQLTKDPPSPGATSTVHSPTRTLTPFQLERYLDYCSEMLSLTSKVAFLYVQEFEDGECVRSVNELENLTTGLARKIWQKIMLLAEERPNAQTPTPSATGRL